MKRIAVLAFGWVLALAFAMTPAGTEIRNQASARYLDSSGQPQTTTSNEVVTVVQPVYGFAITPNGTETDPGQTQSAVPGGRVYFPYTVTNQGNTTDTIDLGVNTNSAQDDFTLENVTIYLDENCDGQVNPGETAVSSVELNMGESACVVVEAALPGTATGGQKGLLNLEGQSRGDTTKTDVDNWAQALATENAALTATKSATPSGEVAPGATITYTIEGANVGGSAAYAVSGVVTVDSTSKTGILITDAIPSGTVYVPGSASGTAGAGAVSVIYQTASGWTTTEPAGADVTAVGLLIEGTGAFFPQGAQYRLNFAVTVETGLAAGTEIENSATVKFDANGDGDAGDPGEEVGSNTTTNPVAPTYAVANGPQGDPDSDGSGFVDTYTDPSGKIWNYTETPDASDPRDDDAETISDTVYGGDTVYFPFTLKNDGNTEDTFNLSLNIVDPDTTDSANPTRWTCQIVAADGTTPISGPVGPIPAGETYDYVVKCSIPADYGETGAADAAHIEVVATSEGDPTRSNKVTGIVSNVEKGYGVDLAQHGNAGDNDPTNDNPPARSADPGAQVAIPFDVNNTGHNPDTYDLAPTLPPGWTGTIYPDADCDGVMDDPTPPPVADTGMLEPGETACFVLMVDVPEDAEPGSNPIKISATSNADPNVSDEIQTAIEVNAVRDLSLTPSRSGTVTSPGTIVYSHTVTNNGNGPVDVRFVLEGGRDNWTYQVSTDGGNTWQAPADAVLADLAAGASAEVMLRVIVPDGEPIGAVDTVELTAKPYEGTTELTDRTPDDNTVTDTTTIVGGDLRLEKEVDKTEAKPGEVLTYTITATNIGTADLKQVIISDPLPGYTEFVSVSATASGFASGAQVYYSTDGSSWSTSAPTALDPGQSIFVAVDTSGDGNITDADLMPPGAKIEIVFQVRVK